LWSRSAAAAAPRTLVHELDLTRALEWAPRVAVRSGGIKRVARGSTRTTLHADRGTAPAAAAALARLETRLDARAATLAAERDSAAVVRTLLPADDEEQAWRDLLVRTLPRGKAPDSAAIQGLVALRLRSPAPLILIEEAIARSLAGEDDLAASIFVALRKRHRPSQRCDCPRRSPSPTAASRAGAGRPRWRARRAPGGRLALA
jgi:hypothetical protein